MPAFHPFATHTVGMCVCVCVKELPWDMGMCVCVCVKALLYVVEELLCVLRHCRAFKGDISRLSV